MGREGGRQRQRERQRPRDTPVRTVFYTGSGQQVRAVVVAQVDATLAHLPRVLLQCCKCLNGVCIMGACNSHSCFPLRSMSDSGNPGDSELGDYLRHELRGLLAIVSVDGLAYYHVPMFQLHAELHFWCITFAIP